MLKVFIGYDPREHDAFQVACTSALEHNAGLDIEGIYLSVCRQRQLYNRRTIKQDGQLYDVISGAHMATEFALSRFLVPQLVDDNDDAEWALFMDCDVLVRCDLETILEHADPKYAVMCVKHDVDHGEGVKMDGCKQTDYPRKNWSSVMLWNLKHPANKRLTVATVNGLRGRMLHQLCWLKQGEIGKLDPKWNHLVGLLPDNEGANIVHYTLGVPSMAGYENCEHSEEWRDQLERT